MDNSGLGSHLARGGGGQTLDVLLVEDNIGDVVLIRSAIAECGLPVKLNTAMDGEEALRILNSGLLPARGAGHVALE